MADYYVSSSTGNNAGAGTEAAPWQTLAKLQATPLLGPDAIVHLRRGDRWAETLTVRTIGNTGGTPGHPVRFTTYGVGADPVISAADLFTWTLHTAVAGGHLYKKVAPGFVVWQMWRENGPIDQGSPLDGSIFNLTRDAALPTALNHWWYDAAALTLYVVVATGEVPGTGFNLHVGHRTTCINEYIGPQNYLEFDGLRLRFTWDGGLGQIHSAANNLVETGWVVTNLVGEWGGMGMKWGGLGTCSFADTRVLTMRNVVFRYQASHGAQLTYLSAGSSLTDCDFIGNGRSGLGIAARGTTGRWGTGPTDTYLLRCRFNQNAGVLNLWTAPATVAGFDHGLYLVGQEPTFQRSGYVLVQDCTADGNGKGGFATDALSSHHRFVRCTSTRNLLFGWMLEGGTTNSSAYNELYHDVAWGNHQSGLHVINCHGPFVAKNCQFYGNGTNGNKQDVYIEWNIGEWHNHAGEVWKHEHIDFDPVTLAQGNATMLTRVANLAALTARGQWTYDPAAETVYMRKTDGSSAAVDNARGNPPYTLDYNNYTPVALQPGGNQIIRVVKSGSTNNGISTLAQLQAAEGQETHGQQVNPLYVNPATLDFRLTPGSPSINAGVLMPGINDIFTGLAPDIGAFETMPPSTTPPTNAGSYAVTATVSDPNYTGSATGTLVISKSTATVVLGNLTQTFDGTPRPVSVVTTPAGLATTVTYDAAA